MFDAKNGAKVARRLYDSILDANEGTGVPIDWEDDTLTAICMDLDQNVRTEQDMSDLIAWTLEDATVDDFEMLMDGTHPMATFVAAALEAEYEFGWGCE